MPIRRFVGERRVLGQRVRGAWDLPEGQHVEAVILDDGTVERVQELPDLRYDVSMIWSPPKLLAMYETQTLHVMVGLPRSGKTTRARQLGAPIVSPDAIRLALHGQRYVAEAEDVVWATAYLMVRSLFLAGHSVVVVDATNVTQKRRQAWVDRFPSPGYEVFFEMLGTPPGVCRDRAIAMGDTEILPVIDRMAEEWDLPGSWK